MITELHKQVYYRGVGELGLSPLDAKQLTSEEMDFIEAGYAQRLMNLGNLIAAAVKKAIDGNEEPFILDIDDEFQSIREEEGAESNNGNKEI